ncbi:hypothetical protein MYX82_04030 [Acidobacteria bacterium AH-259-D05]|nr:hypothetical protein [Acidobacteria bacterium AH-259-D05]
MSWDFFSTRSDSVTVVRERTRTIRIEITETYRETVTRSIDSSTYIRPQLDTNIQLYLNAFPERKRWEEKYLPLNSWQQNYLLPEKKPAKKKDAFDEFFDWLFS